MLSSDRYVFKVITEGPEVLEDKTSIKLLIVSVNIPTGIPLVYELQDDLTPIRNFYLGDSEKVKQATRAVATQLHEE